MYKKNVDKLIDIINTHVKEVIGEDEPADIQAAKEVVVLNQGNVSLEEVIEFERGRKGIENSLKAIQRERAGL